IMEGNIAQNVCPRSLGWLQRQDNDAKPWLWKFSNCFSTPEQNFPLSMENKNAPVELKEAPPAHHPPLQPFAAVPLPDVHSLQPKQIQLPPNPKVSCCSHGSDSSPRVPQLHFGGGSSGNSGGGLIHPGTVLNAPGTGTITWQIGSELACQSSSSLTNSPARSNMAGVCRENPVPSCPHFSCCGKLHFQACHGNLHKLHPFPPHPGCTTPGYFSCSEFSGAAGLSEEHLAQSERMSCVCTNSLHLKVSPSLCLKGSHHCTECLKNLVEAAKMWPDIPPPNTHVAPLSLPLCNGCGTKGTRKEKSLILASSFGQLTPKHGSPEIAISNQLLENLPPIGVFWDIENCSVPSGRSAVTVVQRIREKFFKGHREAEFICVCDISKENKEVIEELNNCQVTVVHINATAKNAADDKLRQSLRRFADTHAAPATVVLVSTDVNFALELSDLRHRHGFHIILVHKNKASEALLHHAHELIRFEEFISDLPPRLPLKKTVCHTLLYVYNLPTNRDSKSICLRLRRLSDNCGGKVLTVSGSSATLRFLSQDSAERAQKRMENEDVFGNRITVSFTPKNRELAETKNAGSSVVEKAKSPKKANRNVKLCLMSKTANDTPSTTKAAGSKGLQGHGPIPKNTAVKSLQELCHLESKTGRSSEHRQDQLKEGVPSLHSTFGTASSVPPQAAKKTGVGEPAHNKNNQKKETMAARSMNSSPVDKKEENAFQVSLPSAFNLLTASRQHSPILIFQSCWSSRSVSPNVSNRSSPLTLNVTNSSSHTDCPDPFANGVDIQISNLDYRLSRKELQQTLQDTFTKHGEVSIEAAISSFALLFVFLSRSRFCSRVSRFGHKLNASDLHKLTDILAIRDQGNGWQVCLLPSSQARQSPLGSSQSHEGSSANCSPVIFEELEYHEPVCKRHCVNKDFSEHEFDPDSYKIPFVIHSLKAFAPQVHSLLQTHEGTVPLLSFQDCYASEFNSLEMVPEGHGGVPLEHLISCIPGVNIAMAQNGIKVVKWIHNKPPPPSTEPWLLRSKSPVGNPQLIQFSRDVIDLLKNQPSCIMSVSKFIPMYHHHFAKQCRVSDYGYSKLIELLESVPHVLQILGIGTKRLLTLTHRAQVKRFTQDLVKLVKSQASKRVVVKEFLHAYHWCFSKDWDVTEYGVCELVDLISEIPNTTISLSQQDNEMVICIPKRERTKEEMERTKQFCKEVIDLLRHQPYFRMPFNKFIPSYHHHFGRQCKLAHYGFTKLLELFEAIPDVLQVLECGEEKILTLTETEQVKALAAQFVKLLRSQKDKCLLMADVLAEYAKTFGYPLRLQDYDVGSVPALMQKLCHIIKVANTDSGKQLQLINKKPLRTLTSHLLVLLMTLDEATVVSVKELKRRYEAVQGTVLNPCEYGFMTFIELLMSVPYFIEVFIDGDAEYVKLTDLYIFAKKVRLLLHTYHYQQIFLHEFPTAYSKYTGEALHPDAYGFNNLEELLGAIPSVVWIKGHGHKKIVVLKNDMKSKSSPFGPWSMDRIMALPSFSSLSAVSHQTEEELLCLSNVSPVDLLCEPVPSCLPSPQLRPDPVVLESTDLIRFEEHSPIPSACQILPPSSAISPSFLPCSSSEQPACRKAMDSPARKQPKSRVKLAANFSFAPVTKL
uniref:Meiosis regulator and mRNA stability factor 1 n=1 Tax=Naja naja TaxID=35670 RepID=A0A8C6XVL6_NAJNA